MSESNVELARRGYEAALRGDLDVIGELLDPDVMWHGGDPTAEGSCHNREEALEFMRQARARRGVGELVDVIDAGDRVVVIMRPPSVAGEPAALSANPRPSATERSSRWSTTPSPTTRWRRREADLAASRLTPVPSTMLKFERRQAEDPSGGRQPRYTKLIHRGSRITSRGRSLLLRLAARSPRRLRLRVISTVAADARFRPQERRGGRRGRSRCSSSFSVAHGVRQEDCQS
jgi:hypothetical protein